MGTERSANRRHPILLAALMCTSLATASACTADIHDADRQVTQVIGPLPGDVPDPESGYAPLAPFPPEMQRLTTAQYEHTIADIFGPGLTDGVTLPLDNDDEGFLSIGASIVGTASGGVEQYRDAALLIAERVLASANGLPLLADCAPTTGTDPCIVAVVQHYGRLLWRRPLSGAEVATYAGIVGAAGETPEAIALGMRYALAGLLQSPRFLYAAYVGEEDPETGARRFTDLEMATRLALWIWNRGPDSELIAAAEAGELTQPVLLSDHAARLLDDPRADELMVRFYEEAWNIRLLHEVGKDTAVFPTWTPSLADAAVEEFRRFISAIWFDRARGALDVFDAGESWVNGELAGLYGLPGVSGGEFRKVALGDERVGLLTSAAVMAANAKPHRTSPTQRGVFVRANLLCLPVPPPPADVEAELEQVESTPGEEPKSIKELLEQHRSDPTCSGCHGLFDPMGLTLEHFDAIGRWRSDDEGVAIDSRATFEGVEIDDARGLAAFLREDPRTVSCLVRRFYSFSTGHVPSPGEAGVLAAVTDAFADDSLALRQLALRVATSSGFRYVGAAVEAPEAPADPSPPEEVGVALPGTLEAEDYLEGGPGVGYYDTTPGNEGGEYRDEDVDIQAATGGGFNVGWIDGGEWLAYAIAVPEGGATFTVTARVAAEAIEERTFSLHVDDTWVAAITFTGSGDWQGWTEQSAVGVELPGGVHALKLVFEDGRMNLDRLTFLAE